MKDATAGHVIDHFASTRNLYKTVIKPAMSYSRRRRIDILLDFVKDKEVLDLGCVEHSASVASKTDWWLHALIKQCAKSVKGVDYDRGAVETLNAQGYDIEVGDVQALDLGKSFDVVMTGELFEHLTNHDSFLQSVKRHLKPGGIWVASMPNANSLNYFIQNCMFGHEVDAWDHSAFFTPITIAVMLKKCGFSPKQVILYQPDEIYHHPKLTHRVLAYLFNRMQQCICWLRPSLSRGLIVVAEPIY